jgi:predicted patatin/cPLA2 family phospholipase
MKKGLVLEGGAMRGMFTAGVMDVLMENGVEFDGAVGVSAGAAFGCNYKSGQIGRVIRYNTRFCGDPRYGGLRCLLREGNLYSKDFCYGEVPLKHDRFDFETYEKNPTEFYVVCTDVSTGEAVYKKCERFENNNFDWIRASASMPLVSGIVEIDGLGLLDGGIADSIPVRFFEGIGYDRCVTVLTQPKGYQKSKNKAIGLMKLKYRKYPKLVQAMEHRHEMYNETVEYIEQKERAGEMFVIRPDESLPIGRVEKDPQKLLQVYELGRAVAQRELTRVKEFLK